MRVLVVTATVAERDAVLDVFGPARLARLVPYVATRVAECGAGTLVVLPGGRAVAARTVAAAVAVNRLSPDVVLACTLGTAPELRCAGDDAVVRLLAERLPTSIVAGLLDPASEGIAVAAAAHGVPFAELTAPDTEALTLAGARAFETGWPALGRRPVEVES